MRNKIIILTLTALLATGCSVLQNVYVDDDKVMKTQRVIYKSDFTDNTWHEQSYSQTLTFVKEKDRDGIVSYKVFDVITLPFESFELEDKMYIIIDDDVLELPVSSENKYYSRNVNEKKEVILQADSTRKTVVTGYDVSNKKTIQFTHQLTDEIVSKMARSSEINLRYYMGPNYINTEIRGGKLKSVKKWIRK